MSATFFGPGTLGLSAFYAAETPKKMEDGAAYPASDFAYVPDKNKSSTWKLRLTSMPGGKCDPRIVGAAVAALGKGFRGQKVQIPAADLPTVKRRVLLAWHATHPGVTLEDVPSVLRGLHAATSLDGVAPPGWEQTIKKMKKSGDIDNPWALSWWLKKTGAHPAPAKHEEDASLDAQIAEALTLLARQGLPAVCYAAARGETWAQAELLASSGQVYGGMGHR